MLILWFFIAISLLFGIKDMKRLIYQGAIIPLFKIMCSAWVIWPGGRLVLEPEWDWHSWCDLSDDLVKFKRIELCNFDLAAFATQTSHPYNSTWHKGDVGGERVPSSFQAKLPACRPLLAWAVRVRMKQFSSICSRGGCLYKCVGGTVLWSTCSQCHEVFI